MTKNNGYCMWCKSFFNIEDHTKDYGAVSVMFCPTCVDKIEDIEGELSNERPNKDHSNLELF